MGATTRRDRHAFFGQGPVTWWRISLFATLAERLLRDTRTMNKNNDVSTGSTDLPRRDWLKTATAFTVGMAVSSRVSSAVLAAESSAPGATAIG